MTQPQQPQQHTIPVPADGITLHLLGSKNTPTLPLPITIWCDGQETLISTLLEGVDAWSAVKEAAYALRTRVKNVSGNSKLPASTVHVFAGAPLDNAARRHLWGKFIEAGLWAIANDHSSKTTGRDRVAALAELAKLNGLTAAKVTRKERDALLTSTSLPQRITTLQ